MTSTPRSVKPPVQTGDKQTAAQKPAARKPRHVPMRTCIGTGEKHPKRDMIRLVRTTDGHIVVDPTGKLSGSRGAYLSKQRVAAEAAIKHRRLEAEFEQAIAKEDTEAILSFFGQFDSG